MVDNFTTIPFVRSNLDLFYIRTSILKAINETIPLYKGKLLDIGCGKMPYKQIIKEKSTVKEYVGIDVEGHLVYDKDVMPDFVWNGRELPFLDKSFDTIIMTEVLEHIPDPEFVLKEAYRVLAYNGCFFLTVPFIWPLHEVPYDEYRYTPYALERILKNAGFNNVLVKAMGGWNASLAQFLGLWVRRSDMAKWKRNSLSFLLKPIIKTLIQKDTLPSDYTEGQMISGLYCIVMKTVIL